jgi:hypothetical protein
MDAKEQQPQQKKIGYIPSLIFLVVGCVLIYFAYNKFILSPKKMESDIEALIAEDLKNSEAELKTKMALFVDDSSSVNKENAVNLAVYIIDKFPKSDESKICDEWFFKNHISYADAKSKYDDHYAQLLKTQNQKILSDLEVNGTQPKDDEMHNNAYIMAKDFVKHELKVPSDAIFGDSYYWGFLSDHIYVIRSTVEAKNSYNAKLKSSWSVKLKFKDGDWTDLSNWQLLKINIGD